MEKATCETCGRVVMASSIKEGKCWTCTRGELEREDSAVKRNSQGVSVVGESSQRAIDVLRTVNQINFIFGVTLSLMMFLFFEEYFGNALAGFIAASVTGLIGVVVWAVNRVFVGIAEDVKGIRERLERS